MTAVLSSGQRDGKADSSEVFRELITLSRSEISIALLGQNQTTEANSNKASAQAGLEVTADIRDADADIIQAAVNQVIRTVVTLNFGDVPSGLGPWGTGDH